MAMKLHKSRIIRYKEQDWAKTTTLCGRMMAETPSGDMNVADTDAEVTCKFCLKRMVV